MIRRLYREQIYEMKDWMEVKIFPVFKKSTGGRKARAKPTTETQKKLNRWNAVYNLYRLIMWNFGEEDLFVDLTYDSKKYEPETEQQAKRDLKNFIERFRYRMQKKGLETKYIYVIERGKRSGHYHHHLIISGGLSIHEIQKLWGYGFVDVTVPDPDETGYFAKAMYMYKQTGNEDYKRILRENIDLDEENEIEEKNKKGWGCSRNLTRKDPAERDCRIGAVRVKEIADEIKSGVYQTLIKYYKGYCVGTATQIDNDKNGGYFIHAILYKNDAHFLKKQKWIMKKVE